MEGRPCVAAPGVGAPLQGPRPTSAPARRVAAAGWSVASAGTGVSTTGWSASETPPPGPTTGWDRFCSHLGSIRLWTSSIQRPNGLIPLRKDPLRRQDGTGSVLDGGHSALHGSIPLSTEPIPSWTKPIRSPDRSHAIPERLHPTTASLRPAAHSRHRAVEPLHPVLQRLHPTADPSPSGISAAWIHRRSAPCDRRRSLPGSAGVPSAPAEGRRGRRRSGGSLEGAARLLR